MQHDLETGRKITTRMKDHERPPTLEDDCMANTGMTINITTKT